MSILSPTDRAVLWRMTVTSGSEERASRLKILASEILESAGRRLDLYSDHDDEVIETVEILDASGLLGRDDLREAFEDADEDDDRAQVFAALLASHLDAAAEIERLGVDVRLRALRLAGVWRGHVRDRASEKHGWLSAAQVAARYGVTPQAVYKWIEAGRVRAERTPGGSWRLAADQFEPRRPRQHAATALKAKLVERGGSATSPSDEKLAAEIVARRRS
ncbi:MAG TPA: helix-turn-helix domain-containing protein [Solirubrobacteraceae bacterium]|jgi:excisionase family DNA binding protein|nr:helix-turn-helix domain-containing protein [Solirubrobacteraceae bacterium]